MPLAGSRDSVPCGVWGNAPTVPRAFNFKEAANKGAGSEASLPVTSRFLRSAPKLLFPTSVLCRAKWARPTCLSFRHSNSFPQARDFASAEATRGLSGRPLDPFGRHYRRRNQQSSSIERKSFYAALFFPAVHPSENPASGRARSPLPPCAGQECPSSV